jgi:hypothetical protein
VVTLGGDPTGTAGVRENRGAGAAWSTPLKVTNVERARRCSFCAASRQVSTGVTHASVPAKISVQSSRVLLANFSSNILCTSGKDDATSWFGTSSLARACGDETAYRGLAERYRAMAESLGFEGHIAMAEAMV